MTQGKRFVLRKPTGDLLYGTEQEIIESLQRGQCQAADFLFDQSSRRWSRVGDHPALAGMQVRPAALPEKRLIYFAPLGSSALLQGPFSTREIQQRIQAREICESTWVFVDGDKEWRPLRGVKLLLDMLPPLPSDQPAAPSAAAAAPTPALSFGETSLAEPGQQTNPSISIDLSEGGLPPPPATEPYALEREEEPTMAFSTLGLSLKAEPEPPAPVAAAPPMGSSASPVAPPSPPRPPAARSAAKVAVFAPLPPRPTAAAAPSGPDSDQGSFDGITAEIPSDPIWLLKSGAAEAVSGPFRFLEVIQFLEAGSITKNDKISRVGTNRFVKILQQYEFNVKYSVETVIEHGVEIQKILIRRRHPRVPYITGVQLMSRHGMLAGGCVNISAGGILIEIAKADFNLGEIMDIKLLPGLINRSIVCRAMVIGKIPKAPPGYALKFEDLKPEDKEAIEHFVQESLKREMPKNG